MCFIFQLLACQEDFRSGEARWGATLSRYRIRIRSLETDNSELKEDLKMMEQERLRSWQIQVIFMHFIVKFQFHFVVVVGR